MLRQWLCAVVVVALAPAPARAADEAPPCQPAKPAALDLISLFPVGDIVRGSQEGGSLKMRVSNKTGRVVCRIFGELTLEAKKRPVTCHEPPVEVGGETDMLCTFMLLPGERKGGVNLPGSRRPGTPAPREKERVKVKFKAVGAELADPQAFKDWQARRALERKRALEQAEAVRAGFRHTVSVKRASNAREVTVRLDRAFARLKECFVSRAKRNPKLHIELKLRLGVSRARTSDGPPESMLAIKVLEQKGPRPEIRDCLEAIELTTLPEGLDFEAFADVTYAAATAERPGGR